MATDSTGPNIELLRTFAVFAADGEVGRTATALGVSTSVVSRRLHELADAPYGLLAKRGNAVVLTEKGAAALPGVTRLLRGYDQLVGRLTNREAVAEVVRVAAGTGLQYTPFPKALAAFRTARPDVGVRVHVCRGRDRLLGVVRGEFDVALVTHDEDRIRAVCGEAVGLCVETLREQPLLVAAETGSADGAKLAAWPEGRPLSPAVLGELELLGIDPQSNVRHQLDRAMVAAGVGVPRRPAVHPGGWTAALACARLGIGSAVVPADLLPGPDAGLVVRPFLSGFRIADRVVWATADDRTGEFVTCMKAAFAPDRYASGAIVPEPN